MALSGKAAKAAAKAAPKEAVSSPSLLADIITQLSKSGNQTERDEKRNELKDRLDRLNGEMGALLGQHHDNFYRSLHSFFGVCNNVDESRARIQSLRGALLSCKTLLQCKRDNLRQLWIEHMEHKEMLRLLSKVEEIKNVPELVEKYLRGKHHVSASKLLVETTTVLESESFGAIKALHDIYRDMAKRRERLHELLIDELHIHLYFKETKSLGSEYWSSQVYDADDVTLVEEDPERNPESISWQYIVLTIRALSVLRRLPEAIEVIKSRLKTELSLLIEKAVTLANENFGPNGATPEPLGPRALCRLLTDIYEKMLQTLKAHSYALATIRLHKDGRNSLSGDAGEYSEAVVWKAIQLEIEVLLSQYLELDTDTQATVMAMLSDGMNFAFDSNDPTNELDSVAYFSQSQSRRDDKKRNRTKLFAFSNSQNAMTETSLNMERALHHDAGAAFPAGAELNDRYTNNSASTMKQLCKKDVANITGVFKPTMMFVDEVNISVAKYSNQTLQTSGLRNFVDIVARHAFLHHLRDDVRNRLKVLNDAIDKPTEPQTHSQEHSLRMPLLLGTKEIFNMIGRLVCLTVDIPPLTNDFIMLIHSLLAQYKGICRGRFHNLVKTRRAGSAQTRKSTLILSAEWQEDERVCRVLRRNNLWVSIYGDEEADRGETSESYEDEAYSHMTEHDLLYELQESGHPITKGDIMSDHNSVRELANLSESLLWLSERIIEVSQRLESDPAAAPSIWPDLTTVMSVADEGVGAEVATFVTSDAIDRLFAVGAEFRQLSQSCILVLRLEVRCQSLFYILSTIRKSNNPFVCDIEAVEADPAISTLDKELRAYDEILMACLPPKIAHYIFEGLPEFMSKVLIEEIKSVKVVNEHGVKRMCRNIFALQQNLTNIMKIRANGLDKAMQFYELLQSPVEDVLNGIVTNGPAYSEKDYRELVSVIIRSSKFLSKEESSADALRDALQGLGTIFHELV